MKSIPDVCSADEGTVCAEFACGTVAAVACALVLRLVVVSPWLTRNLARPFGLALASIF